ncbi:glycoside hydrolase family 19 protein [Cupriavidus gilardii]|uniref:glycoside hydrolase family 19 protein n=1 Tax=Cupriavidus gilardii TaxID=82541 RepID=UPI0007E3F1A2|nr:glycoside hydrolase family 19 protein [Cupriavidus gilardii]
MIDAAKLRVIMPYAGARADVFVLPLIAAMDAYAINTPARAAAFLAQVGHESGQLRHLREIWGPTPAQRRYEGRADLGNTEPGDGKRFMGRGLIQITGRKNYLLCGFALELDLVARPELLEQPVAAAASAAWYWHNHNLNRYADAGDFVGLTHAINGGTNGIADRRALWNRAKAALGVRP